jgi:hypothetical protein
MRPNCHLLKKPDIPMECCSDPAARALSNVGIARWSRDWQRQSHQRGAWSGIAEHAAVNEGVCEWRGYPTTLGHHCFGGFLHQSFDV